LEEIIFEIFNISENNIISVELAKVLGYGMDKKGKKGRKKGRKEGRGSSILIIL
jgi:hypothetical protein